MQNKSMAFFYLTPEFYEKYKTILSKSALQYFHKKLGI